MELSRLLYKFDVQRSQGLECAELKNEILKTVEENSMSSLYTELVAKHNWDLNSELVATMDAKNEADLAAIEAKHQDAITNAGDMEVLDQMIAKAKHFAKIGNWKEAVAANDLIIAKEKTGTGKKVDAQMEKAKIALFNMDVAELKKVMAEAKNLLNKRSPK